MSERTSIDAEKPQRDQPHTTPGLIVALGASAGGLDALDRFFSAISPMPDAAFVVIQHLAPEHKTMMDTLLARHTEMQVRVASNGEKLVGGKVYVIPPGAVMTIKSGELCLVPRPATGITLPIDTFFESLATHVGPRAVGIILSGTGSDGALGSRKLAAAGAWIMAQDPDTARFDGMPRNVIMAGVIDHILPPEDIAKEVMSIGQSGAQPQRAPDNTPLPADEVELGAKIVRLLHGIIPIAFENYKPGTIVRRVLRRMNATSCETVEDYAKYLSSHAGEVKKLRHELLIPVTSFFRDSDAFEALNEKVIKRLVSRRAAEDADTPLRVWVTACATGEEAYSLAILLHEAMQAAGQRCPLKMFATDVEPDYVAAASAGRYDPGKLSELDQDLRERWFERMEDGSWRVLPKLRNSIVFSRHDVLNDAPFTQMDLITCRNLLIYMRPEAQNRILRRLSYSLKDGGVLFLGSSESLDETADNFATLDARNKLFRLQGDPVRLTAMDLLGRTARDRPAPGYRTAKWHSKASAGANAAKKALVDAYAPPSVLVDMNRNVLHTFGNTEHLVRLPMGTATLDVLQLVPPALSPVLSTLLHSASREKSVQRSAPIGIAQDGGAEEFVKLSVTPLDNEDLHDPLLLVVFEPPAAAHREEPLDSGALAQMSTWQAAELERELEMTRTNLQETIQDFGTVNEELQATNEELMASNEELQSTNEELQSVNEELHTVNVEYQARIAELNELNADLEGLTRAARIPLVFLDGELNITRFTPQSLDLFNLREGDVGRPLSDITQRLDFTDLLERTEEAHQNQQSYQRTVNDDTGGSWLVTIQPYSSRSLEHTRIVISCVDVSSVRDAQRLQSIIDATPGNLAVIDQEGRLTAVNRAWTFFRNENGGGRACGVGSNYLAECQRCAEDDISSRRALHGLEEVLSGRRQSFSMLYPCHSPTVERWFVLNAAALPEGGAVVAHVDLTHWIDPLRAEELAGGDE
ncbi:CheR family methyltransferase [Rhodovulum adriaticum]|uniref:Two-component system CheB/CheR fusion protein n=1 Tax=Rhodovulum adriaticum TaxID=35804 RepID=A0A4R2NLB9_RHOAD|nr:chemotaxis protein CheB [Rhodovulum adriaticum]TCP22423.1 two-component system CheB/CheR fusion protein [Rhodovulum adriaticum]